MYADVLLEMDRRIQRIEERLEELEIRDVENPIVIYSTNAGQSISNDTQTTVNFEDVVYDPDGLVTVGANWAYTAPVSGHYVITAVVSFATTTAWTPGTDIAQLRALVAGTDAYIFARLNDESSADHVVTLAGSVTVQANASESIAVQVYQSSGGLRTLHTSATINHVTIYRVGAG
jgi:hypothetical protein